MAWEIYNKERHGEIGNYTIRMATWSHICKTAGYEFESTRHVSYKGCAHQLDDLQDGRKPTTNFAQHQDGKRVSFHSGINGYTRYNMDLDLIEVQVNDEDHNSDDKDYTTDYNTCVLQDAYDNTLFAVGDTVRIYNRSRLTADLNCDKYGDITTSHLFPKWRAPIGHWTSITESSITKLRRGMKITEIGTDKRPGVCDPSAKIVWLSGTYGDVVGVPFKYLEVQIDTTVTISQRQAAHGQEPDKKTPSKVTKPQPTKETKESIMTPNFDAKAIMDQNKDALLLAAKIEVGEAAVKQVSKIIKGQLPLMVKGYAELPIFDILVANLVVMSIKQFAPENEKAQIIADAMLLAAMQKQMKEFNIPKMVDDFVSGIDVSAITSLQADK